MNKLTLIFILGFLILFLIGVIVVLAKVISHEKEKSKELELSLLSAKRSLAGVLQHIEELAKIYRDDKDTSLKIAEAKTDEEVFDIINAIISANNDKLRNDSKDNPSTKTGKKGNPKA